MVLVPRNYGFPVKRPSFITNARWVGGDDDLSLEVEFVDAAGNPRVLSFPTTNTENGVGEICLPKTGPTIDDIARDALIASIRMATFISKTVAGSIEWKTAMEEQEGGQSFQLAIGKVVIPVDGVRLISDSQIEVDVKKDKTSLIRTLVTGHDEISMYTLTPETQLWIVPGSVEAAFPAAIHDYPNEVLTSAEKQAILDYVVALEPWI